MSQLNELILSVKEIVISVANLQNIYPEQIEDEASFFAGGIGLDSIDILELIVVIEKKFGLKIRNDEIGKECLKNPRTLASAINDHLSNS